MNQRGFTLVELMVALTIMLFLLVTGMPMLGTFTGNVRLRVASEGMLDGLALARNEAIRRNTTVLYRYTGAEWFVVLPGANGGPEHDARASRGGTEQRAAAQPRCGAGCVQRQRPDLSRRHRALDPADESRRGRVPCRRR